MMKPAKISTPSHMQHFHVTYILFFSSAEIFRSFFAETFGHWNISFICLTQSQLYENSPPQYSLAYIFRHSDQNDLIFFSLSYFKTVSVYDRNKQPLGLFALPSNVMPSNVSKTAVRVVCTAFKRQQTSCTAFNCCPSLVIVIIYIFYKNVM